MTSTDEPNTDASRVSDDNRDDRDDDLATDPAGRRREPEQQRIAEVQQELDDRAEGDGLAAEAGAGEEYGLSQG